MFASLLADLFDKFRNRDGRFNESLNGEISGLLNLYEASFFGIQGEDVLEEAKCFRTRYLKELLGKLETNIVAGQIQQSLQTPVYWRMPSLEAQNFIKLYPTHNQNSLVLLELAKLDYNLVQTSNLRNWQGQFFKYL